MLYRCTLLYCLYMVQVSYIIMIYNGQDVLHYQRFNRVITLC